MAAQERFLKVQMQEEQLGRLGKGVFIFCFPSLFDLGQSLARVVSQALTVNVYNVKQKPSLCLQSS